MKKSLRFCVLLVLAATLLTVSAFADTGPKPQLTVKVTNPPEELYYLDLLAVGDWEHAGGADYSGLDWSYSEEEIAALDSGLLDALRAAVPDGWHACTAEGSNGAPMWGDLAPHLWVRGGAGHLPDPPGDPKRRDLALRHLYPAQPAKLRHGGLGIENR